jgi:dihydroxyacetone kinase-like protein
MMDQVVQRKLIQAVAETMIAHAGELTSLDQAIGDGDHGLNMKRGFEGVLADIDSLASQSLPDALKAIGTQLVMKVGGASGPLYGTLLMTLGKGMPADPTLDDIGRCFGAAVDAVKARGKSDIGQKDHVGCSRSRPRRASQRRSKSRCSDFDRGILRSRSD